ncbi:hypothetical protein RNY54_RS27450, partial [Escherichia coli]
QKNQNRKSFFYHTNSSGLREIRMLYTKVNFIDATGYTYCWDRYYRQKILRGSKPQLTMPLSAAQT